jgi:hypothetical protein
VWTILDQDEEPILTVFERDDDDHPVGVGWSDGEDGGHEVYLTLTEAGEMCSALLEVVNSRLAKEVQMMRLVTEAAVNPRREPAPRRRGW